MPRLKVTLPSTDITGSPISFTNGTRNYTIVAYLPNRVDDDVRSRALPECDLQEVRNLKAFIAYDAIVHPDHPLSTGGEGGVKLYLGTAPLFNPLVYPAF